MSCACPILSRAITIPYLRDILVAVDQGEGVDLINLNSLLWMLWHLCFTSER